MTVAPATEPVAPSAPVAGIIYPPPEVRTIIDKTASFVAKNGEKFQERIRDKEIDNPKFNFLQDNDAYHAYYLFKVNEYREGKVEAKKEEPVQKDEEASGKKAPTEPPPFEFSADMPGISAQDLDVLKLTAQFMARNGRQFMTGLSQRESRNYQFDFLRPNHSLFPFFTMLVDHYTKVFAPSKTIKDTLLLNATDKSKLIARVKERAEWITYQEVERKRIEEEAEKEREAYAAIDWHDFSVIGVIEFTGDEDLSELPGPVDLATLQKRSLVEKKTMPLLQLQVAKATTPAPQSEIQEVNMDLEEEVEMDLEESPKETEEQLPIPSLPQGPIKIVKDYVPRANIAPKPKEQVFTYQGVEVPASKLSQHMRIELLDPKWKEQRDIAVQKNKESNLTSDEFVGKNLENLAKYRTDIFGSVEVGIGRKVGEEEEKAKIMKEVNAWDGTSAITATKAATAIEEQIAAIHRAGAENEGDIVGPQVPSEVKTAPVPPFQAQAQPPAPTPTPPLPPATRPISAPGIMPPGVGAPGMLPPGVAPPGVAPPVPGLTLPGMGVPGYAPPGIRAPGMAPSPVPGMGLGPPGAARPPFPPMGVPPLPPGVAVPAVSQIQEPPAKKIKLDEFGLIPEEEYLANNSGPVSIRVQVQQSSEEKGTWKLNGQTLNISIDIKETIAKLKELLQGEIEMPPNKMNLKLLTAKEPDALGFLRDQNTLAYYNINNVSILQLTKKERGRKK